MIIDNFSFENSKTFFSEFYNQHYLTKMLGDKNLTNETSFKNIPIYTTLANLSSHVNSKNFNVTSAIVTMAILNGQSEFEEFFSALKQLKSKFTGKEFKEPYDNKIAQHSFSFFRGTLLSNYMNPNSENCLAPNLCRMILKYDKSFLESKWVDSLRKKMNIGIENLPTKIESIYSTREFPRYIHAKLFKTNSYIKEIFCRSMARTTIYGSLVLAIIEGFKIHHNVTKENQELKSEIGKSALNLAGAIAGVGVLGAIGAKHCGPLGSLTGITIGSFLGERTPKLFFS